MHVRTIYECTRYVKAYRMTVTTDDRPDLAAMLLWLTRALIDAEAPVLAANDLTMWAYSVLTALATGPTRTQAALARAIRADKTRIIPVLDDLQERGLIERQPDPVDRRVRLLAITPAGRRAFTRTRSGIRAGEERVLALVPAADRRAFLRTLRALSDVDVLATAQPRSTG
jgi:MarR family transcriptional regulator, organic hydroperoxide resistance regulator